MSTDRPPTPPLDLEAIERSYLRGETYLDDFSTLLAEVRRLRAEVEDQKRTIGMLIDVGNDQEEVIGSLRAEVAREKEVFSLAGNKICKQADEIDRLRAEVDAERVKVADLIDAVQVERNRNAALRADLAACRAALAPLLENPYQLGMSDHWVCRFCFAREGQDHAPDCAYLRRAALLGAGGEGDA